MQSSGCQLGNAPIVFFFKQKTAYELRNCDWSSDVCSSDLAAGAAALPGHRAQACLRQRHRQRGEVRDFGPGGADRESGVSGESVDLGGRHIHKNR